MIHRIQLRVRAWMRGSWDLILRPSTQRTAGWVLICAGWCLFGMAVGFGIGVDYISSVLRYDFSNNHHAFTIFANLALSSLVPFVVGIWMLRHARRREHGLPADPLSIGGAIANSIRQIREDWRESSRLAEEREKKKAIFGAWRNR
jgi:uncharacterized membrane protein YbhN (UPF0104 family)